MQDFIKDVWLCLAAVSIIGLRIINGHWWCPNTESLMIDDSLCVMDVFIIPAELSNLFLHQGAFAIHIYVFFCILNKQSSRAQQYFTCGCQNS